MTQKSQRVGCIVAAVICNLAATIGAFAAVSGVWQIFDVRMAYPGHFLGLGVTLVLVFVGVGGCLSIVVAIGARRCLRPVMVILTSAVPLGLFAIFLVTTWVTSATHFDTAAALGGLSLGACVTSAILSSRGGRNLRGLDSLRSTT